MPARAPKVPGGREGSKNGCRDRGKDAPAEPIVEDRNELGHIRDFAARHGRLTPTTVVRVPEQRSVADRRSPDLGR